MSTIAKLHKQAPVPVPDGLEGIAAATWCEIVASLPPNYLRPGDLPLLRAYCIAVATYAEAQDLLGKEGIFTEGKAHPALAIADQQAKQMMALAGKLRLCPSSRIRADSADLRRAHEGPTTPEKAGAARFFT